MTLTAPPDLLDLTGALCATDSDGSHTPNDWDGSHDRVSPARRQHAALLCATCPVRQQCLQVAQAQRTARPGRAHEAWRPYGLWGGLWFDGTAAAPVRLTTTTVSAA